MVAVNQIRDEYRLEATAVGVDATAAAAGKLAAANDAVVTSSEKVERRTISVANALDRFARQNDAVYRAQQMVARGQALINAGFEQGQTDTVAYQRALAGLAEAELRLARASAQASAANENHARTTGIASHQLTNLTYQLSDVATSLAGGASAFQVFTQQAGQIGPILAETGVGGAIRGVGTAIGRFLTPATVTVGLLTAAVGYAYSAWSRYDDETRRVGTTLEGLGRSTGLTRQGFEQLAAASSAAGNVTVRQATDLAQALAATGRIGPENIKRIIAVSKDMAATFGTDLAGIKDKLADAFSTPEGIARLNQQLTFLDARAQATIESLFRQGRAQEAIRLAVDALPPALAKSEAAQGAVAKAWEAIKNAASDADHAVGRAIDRIVNGPSAAQKLADLKAKVEYDRQAAEERLVQPGSVSRTYVPPTAPTVASTTSLPRQETQGYEADLRKALEARAELTRQEEAAAQKKELEASLTRKSQELKKLTEEAGLGTEVWKNYRDWSIQVKEALSSGDPELMKRVDNIRDLNEASKVFEQATRSMTTAEGERMTAAERATRQEAVDIAGVRARTVEERARVAQMGQVERQRGQLITQAQAEAAAEHAAQMVREQANQQLRDMLRDQGLEADEIRRKTALIGQSAEARAVATARQRVEQDLTRQGIDLNGELAQSVIRGAEANARLGVSYDRAAEAQQRLQDGQRSLGQSFTQFFDTLLSGAGNLTSAFASLSRTLLSGGLQAVLTGEGSLAGLFGTANPERGQVGGLLGGITPSFLRDAVRDGARTGTEAGASSGLSGLTDLFGGANGRQLLQGAAGVAMIGGSYSIGQQSRGVTGLVGGAVSGALGGAMLGSQIGAIGGPVGAVAGAAIGLIGSFLGQEDARRQRRQEIQDRLNEYADQYRQNRAQIDQFRSGLRGEGVGGVETQITAAFAQMVQANLTASRGGDQASADAMVREFEQYRIRMREQVSQAFQGTLEEVRAGLGTNGPFAQAAASVVAFGETLKAFAADAEAARGDAATGATAREAARQAALGQLQVAPTLSATQTELARIQGTAAGLRTVLVSLGLSADEAGRAIEGGVNKALDALRDKFDTDIGRKLNEARGQSYLNDASDLIQEVVRLQQDAASVGGSAQQVEAYFVAAAQKIVNEAALTGDAFDALVQQFPELQGRVHEFTGALDEASRRAAVAARALGYGDRLFAATNDTSTLAGQLAAFDRQAAREREAEIEAGGEAIAELEAAQYAERLRLIQDFQDRAAEAERQRMEEAQRAFEEWSRNIKAFVEGLKTGSSSPLSPADRLAAAQAAYNRQLALAQGGDRDALNSITQYASDLLEAGKAMYSSSEGYQQIFDLITQQLTGLPGQVSAEQFIVNAIDASKAAVVAATQAMQSALLAGVQANSPALVAQALTANFNRLDTSVNGLLDYGEFLAGLGPLATRSEQTAARAIFSSIDADGDGQLSLLELIRARTAGTESWTAQTTGRIDGSNSVLSAINNLSSAQNSNLGQLVNLNNSISSQNGFVRDNTGYANQILGNQYNTLAASYNIALKQLHNLQYANAKAGAAIEYATGGWVSGPGTGTSDSIRAMLSDGEFVVNAASARMYGPLLEAMNDNRGLSLPLAPLPVPVAGGDGGTAAEIRALRAELKAALEMVARVTAATGDKVADRVEGVREEAAGLRDDGRRAAKRSAVGSAGRGEKAA